MAKAVKQGKRHEDEKLHDKEKAIRDIVRDVTNNVIYHCTHAADNRPECILRHIEEIDTTLVSTYTSEKLRETYTSLSEEEQEQVATKVQKKLREYLKKLCEAYWRLSRVEEFEEEGKICNSL